jgi:hypothetical protein
VDTAQPAEALIVPISSSLQDWAQMAGEDFAHYAPPPSFWGAVENLGWPTGLASIALTVDQSDTLDSPRFCRGRTCHREYHDRTQWRTMTLYRA